MRSNSRDLQPHPMWLFEENYLMIRRLFAELRTGLRFVLSTACGRRALQVTVDDCSRLRVYHDARLVEVLGYQECMAIPPPYAAESSKGFVRDERKQVNRLLYEVLRHCLDHGYGVTTLQPQTDPA